MMMIMSEQRETVTINLDHLSTWFKKQPEHERRRFQADGRPFSPPAPETPSLLVGREGETMAMRCWWLTRLDIRLALPLPRTDGNFQTDEP